MEEALWLKNHFKEIQFALLIGFFFAGYKMLKPNEGSNFKLKEADAKKNKKISPHGPSLADARIKTTPSEKPLLLSGIQTDAEPHIVLQIKASATRIEIIDAWKRLLKQYHPDSIARPGTAQWNEAQSIAVKINQAKEIMLKKLGQ